MFDHASRYEFEKAAEIRDKVLALESLLITYWLVFIKLTFRRDFVELFFFENFLAWIFGAISLEGFKKYQIFTNTYRI